MPDSNPLRDAATRGAYGHFAEHPDLSNWEIGNRIIERMQIEPGGDRIRIQNWVRAARRRWDDAQEARETLAGNVPWRPGVGDPSLDDSLASYRYRALVELTDPDTGDRYATVVVVDSSAPLSLDQIRQEALDSWLAVRGPDRFYVDRSSIGGMASGEVTVLSGGYRIVQ